MSNKKFTIIALIFIILSSIGLAVILVLDMNSPITIDLTKETRIISLYGSNLGYGYITEEGYVYTAKSLVSEEKTVEINGVVFEEESSGYYLSKLKSDEFDKAMEGIVFEDDTSLISPNNIGYPYIYDGKLIGINCGLDKYGAYIIASIEDDEKIQEEYEDYLAEVEEYEVNLAEYEEYMKSKQVAE